MTDTRDTAPLVLGTEKIGKLLMQYAIPAIIAMTASSLYNMVDSIFIGHGVGPLAIAGLAITFPFMNLAAAFGSLVGVGASTLVAIKLGQKDKESATHVLGNVVMLNGIIGLVFMTVALLFLDPILLFFGASPDTLPYAREYMQVILAGEASAIGWYANVNPLVVVLTVNLVTSLMRKKSALFSMTCGMFIMPISALCMASGNMLGGGEILGLHPVAFMMIVGIVFQGLAEVFISPRFLEYFSLQAPKGEEGMYLGFSHLHSFLSSIFGFGLSGFLLSKYCPARELFSSEADWEAASANAHYIWYYFAAIALVSAVALIIHGNVVRRLDAKKAAVTQ